MKAPIAVVGAGVVAPWGLGRRGAAAFLDVPRPSRQLQASHPEVAGFEVPQLQPEQDAGDRRQMKLMSQGARLGAIAIREALRDAAWQDGRENIGCFLGVGASGARMEQIPAALEASLHDGVFSEAAFGERGLYACNPLFVFQLMNNFSLCHGAIIAGIGGPNGAYYSRGAGTWSALEEAVASLDHPCCSRVLAGGTDSAHHAATWAELRREGLAGHGLIPSEGAAVLALERQAAAPLALITSLGCGAWPDVIPAPDAILLSAWNPALLESLGGEARRRWPVSRIRHCLFGEALAAGPALAWATGLDLLNNGLGTCTRGSENTAGVESVLVLTMGVDGELGHLCLRRR